MTRSAIIHHLCLTQFRNCGIPGAGPAKLSLPLVMRLQWPMTRLATDGGLGHGCVITIARDVVIFANPRIVARGAHLVPVHAAPGPVPPFARFPVFVAEHVKPFVSPGVIGGFEGLQASVTERHQILPQGILTNDALDRKSLRVAGKARGVNLKLAIGRSHFESLTAGQK